MSANITSDIVNIPFARFFVDGVPTCSAIHGEKNCRFLAVTGVCGKTDICTAVTPHIAVKRGANGFHAPHANCPLHASQEQRAAQSPVLEVAELLPLRHNAAPWAKAAAKQYGIELGAAIAQFDRANRALLSSYLEEFVADNDDLSDLTPRQWVVRFMGRYACKEADAGRAWKIWMADNGGAEKTTSN